MVAQDSPGADRLTPEVISLPAATARALRKIAPGENAFAKRGIEARNVIAVALSALLSIYKRDSRTGKLQAVTEVEFVSGRFIDGGARFAFDNQRPDLEGLVVKNAELDDAIATISASFIGERYLSTHEQASPKRLRR